MVTGLLSAIVFLLGVLGLVIFVQVVLSWLVVFNVINTHNDFVRNFLRALDYITEPIYRPIRKVLPDFGGIDFSPLVVLLVIQVLRIILSDTIQSIQLSG
jgi:YggT family protein